MSRSWYILQVYTGYEKKICTTIGSFIADGTFNKDYVIQVKNPTEELVDVRDGKKRVKNSLILPGYVMIEMDLPAIGWKDICSQIRRIRGVNGFVGTSPSEKPRPITPDEAKRMLLIAGEIKGEKTVRVNQSYEIGDNVKITDGPFASFSGKVEEILADKNKLRVNVQIFGRLTAVEVDILQVQKI